MAFACDVSLYNLRLSPQSRRSDVIVPFSQPCVCERGTVSYSPYRSGINPLLLCHSIIQCKYQDIHTENIIYWRSWNRVLYSRLFTWKPEVLIEILIYIQNTSSKFFALSNRNKDLLSRLFLCMTYFIFNFRIFLNNYIYSNTIQ